MDKNHLKFGTLHSSKMDSPLEKSVIDFLDDPEFIPELNKLLTSSKWITHARHLTNCSRKEFEREFGLTRGKAYADYIEDKLHKAGGRFWD